MRNLMVSFLVVVSGACADLEDANLEDATIVEPIACTTNSECGESGCCGFADGWEEPTCVESPASTCDVPGTLVTRGDDDGAANVHSVANGSATLKDTCYCSAGTYKVRWCYSSTHQYWYTSGYC